MGARFEALNKGARRSRSSLEIDWIFFSHFNFPESAVFGIPLSNFIKLFDGLTHCHSSLGTATYSSLSLIIAFRMEDKLPISLCDLSFFHHLLHGKLAGDLYTSKIRSFPFFSPNLFYITEWDDVIMRVCIERLPLHSTHIDYFQTF